MNNECLGNIRVSNKGCKGKSLTVIFKSGIERDFEKHTDFCKSMGIYPSALSLAFLSGVLPEKWYYKYGIIELIDLGKTAEGAERITRRAVLSEKSKSRIDE